MALHNLVIIIRCIIFVTIDCRKSAPVEVSSLEPLLGWRELGLDVGLVVINNNEVVPDTIKNNLYIVTGPTAIVQGNSRN